MPNSFAMPGEPVILFREFTLEEREHAKRLMRENAGPIIPRPADESIPLSQRRYFSIRTAAEYSDLSQQSIRNFIAAGKLHPLRPCRGKILIDRIELESLISTSTATPRKSRGRHSQKQAS